MGKPADDHYRGIGHLVVCEFVLSNSGVIWSEGWSWIQKKAAYAAFFVTHVMSLLQ
jgi:hypothetical protein